MKPITTLTIALLLPLLSWSQVKCPCDMSKARKVDEEMAKDFCDGTKTGANVNRYMFNTSTPVSVFHKIVEVSAPIQPDCINSIEQYNACVADWIRINYSDLKEFECVVDRYIGNPLIGYLGRNNHDGLSLLIDKLTPHDITFLNQVSEDKVLIEGHFKSRNLNLLDALGIYILDASNEDGVTRNCILYNKLSSLGLQHSTTGGIDSEMQEQLKSLCADEEEDEDPFDN